MMDATDPTDPDTTELAIYDRPYPGLEPTDADLWCEQTGAELEAVAAYIRRHGWCQTWYWTTDGKVCLIGAVIKCGFSHLRQVAVMWALRDYLVSVDAIPYYSEESPSSWNDRPTTAEADVLAALAGATAMIRERATEREK